eukprot:TRINITY_DN9471_c0_g2_i1.p1 TRINITY_DN9471_c0_g2~~TRINITY_DN9471_c0_g2_i1.p1  ORF type:complete len:1402 (-),score=281.26 TRINITY_DN9471_c0_g2_i1:30-4235(-)
MAPQENPGRPQGVPALNLRRSTESAEERTDRTCRLPPFPARTLKATTGWAVNPSPVTSPSPRSAGTSSARGGWIGAAWKRTSPETPPLTSARQIACSDYSRPSSPATGPGKGQQAWGVAATRGGASACAEKEMAGALETLFQTYDLDGSGSIDLDEFVATQGEVVAEDGRQADTSELVAQYLQARAPGEVGLQGGGLDFPTFADWQLRQRYARASKEELAQDCYRLGERLSAKRPQSGQTARSGALSRPLLSSRASTRASARNWPPEVAIAAEREAAEQRAQLNAPKRRFENGGGMTSTRKGFVSKPKEAARDIRAFEKQQRTKDSSSDDEEYMRKQKHIARQREKETMEVNSIAQMDTRSAQLSRQLLENLHERRQALIPSELEACRKKDEEARGQLHELVDELSLRYKRLMVLRGRVTARADPEPLGTPAKLVGVERVEVDLKELSAWPTAAGETCVSQSRSAAVASAASTRSSKDGSFKLSMDVKPEAGGKPLSLALHHRLAADLFRRLGGQGLRRPGLELLPLSQVGEVEAVPGSAHVAVFEDAKSGARFFLPIGKVLQDGESFSGEVKLLAAVVVPEYGTLSRTVFKLKKRESEQDLLQAATSSRAAAAAGALPECMGRTLGGQQVPVSVAAAVFLRLTDATGTELALSQDAGIMVELWCHSLGMRRMRRPPSLWRFDSCLGEWTQTLQPLSANRRELPPPKLPQEEAAQVLEWSATQAKRPALDEGRRAQEQREEVVKLKAAQEALRLQLKGQPEESLADLCICGFDAREAIVRRVRQEIGLQARYLRPPKRLFAGVEPDDEGHGLRCSFLYNTLFDLEQGAARAAADPEVMVTHHLFAAHELLEPSQAIAKDLGLGEGATFTQKHYELAARRVVPHLQQVAAYLVAGARAEDLATGTHLKDVGETAVRLHALESLVSRWIRPRCSGSPPSTTQELWEILTARGNDIAASLLVAGLYQARRDQLAQTRKALGRRDPLLWASYHEVVPAVEGAQSRPQRGQSIAETAAAQLAQDASIKERAQVSLMRQMVRSKMSKPGPRPTMAQVKAVLQGAAEHKWQLEVRLQQARSAGRAAQREAEQAAGEQLAAEKAMAQARQRADPTEQLSQGKAAKAAAARADVAKAEASHFAEESRTLAEALVAENKDGPAQRLLEEIQVSSVPESDNVDEAWEQVLAQLPVPAQEHGMPDILSFSFQAHTEEWNAVALAEAPQPAASCSSKEALPPTEPGYDGDDDVLEYFAPQKRPALPVLKVSSLVAGAFRDGAAGQVATEVACNSLGSCSVSRSEVLADGTFCLFAAPGVLFELWFTLTARSSEPLRFGPFMAKSSDEVTYVGVLEPKLATKAGQWRKTVNATAALIRLPRLEDPAAMDAECCTCKKAGDSSEEQSKVLSSPGDD